MNVFFNLYAWIAQQFQVYLNLNFCCFYFDTEPRKTSSHVEVNGDPLKNNYIKFAFSFQIILIELLIFKTIKRSGMIYWCVDKFSIDQKCFWLITLKNILDIL